MLRHLFLLFLRSCASNLPAHDDARCAIQQASVPQKNSKCPLFRITLFCFERLDRDDVRALRILMADGTLTKGAVRMESVHAITDALPDIPKKTQTNI